MSGLASQVITSLTELGAIELGCAVNHVVGTTPVVLVNPKPGESKLVLSVDAGEFRIRLGDQAPQTFTANAATDNLSINDHRFETGDGPYRVTNSGGALPAGLTVDTDYFVIADGSDTVKLATSTENAENGVHIDLTDVGSGTQTITGLFNVAEAPAASVSDGTGAIKVSAGQSLVLPGPALVTVVGFDVADILTYYFV